MLLKPFREVFTEESCDVKKSNISAVAQWSNQIFAQKDTLLQRRNWNSRMIPKDIKRLREFFYRMSAQALSNHCNSIKTIGGEKWLGGCGFLNGEKLVCMDRLYQDLQENGIQNCLIYSFGVGKVQQNCLNQSLTSFHILFCGLGDEWSFETKMAEMGCMVHAYDPTVTLPPNSTHLKFYPMGLGHQDDPENSKMPILTLQTILEQNGDSDKQITYLKLDIEQAEIQVMEQLISTEIFNQVSQIGIEVHTGELESRGQILNGLSSLLKSFYHLHSKGFRLVYYYPNDCMHKSYDSEGIFYNFFDLLFTK